MDGQEVQELICIYALCDPRDGKMRYVGSTINPKRRLAIHWNDRWIHYSSPKGSWIKELDAVGLRPTMKTLDEVEAPLVNDAEEAWIYWLIDQGEPLLNKLPPPRRAWEARAIRREDLGPWPKNRPGPKRKEAADG